MKETLMIAFDNSYYSQNQDYHPNRNIAQKKIIESLIYDILPKSPENTVGFAPLASLTYQICTPTNDTHSFITQLSNVDLQDPRDPNAVIESCLSAFHNRSGKKIFLLFIGSEMDITESIINMINEDINVYVVAFGCGGDLVLKTFEAIIDSNSYHHTFIASNQDFYGGVMDLLGRGGVEMEDDPDLALALKLSMQDQ